MALKPKMGPFKDPERQYRPLGVLVLTAVLGIVLWMSDIGQIVVDIAN